MTNIVLTGATGLLGPVLVASLREMGNVTGVARTVSGEGMVSCDLCDAPAVSALIKNARPAVVVHLAALTDVDACEEKPGEAFRQNVLATRHLAEECAARLPGARLVFISTDQVYDAPGPSGEEAVQPKNVYALTKLWGEDIVRQLEHHLVLRVNFFSGRNEAGRGLVPWLEARAGSGTQVPLFSDVLFNPLHVAHLSQLVREMIERECTGTFNLGSEEEGLSKAQFLRRVAERLGFDSGNFTDCPVADAGLRAYRPRDMRMRTHRVREVLGRDLPSIGDGLDLLASEAA